MSVLSSHQGNSALRRDIRQFVFCERGAVTIDWVAICAAILLVGITVVYGIFNSGVAGTAGPTIASIPSAKAISVAVGMAHPWSACGSSAVIR